MDESFELLSSMSPKLKKNATKQNKNPKSKGPSKLALRRYFRKSIGFDSLKKTKDNSLLCLNDNEDEEDDRSSDESYKGKIIADSFEQKEEKDKENEKETIEDSFMINGKVEKSDLNTKTETKAANFDFDEQRLDEINDVYIETDKYRQIENWIANIPSQQEQSFYSSSYRHFIEEKKIEDNIEKVKQEELNKNNFDDDDDVIVIEDSVVIEGDGNSDAENKEDDNKNKNVVIEILDSPLMTREKEREESDCGDESEHNISMDRFMENINKKKNNKDTKQSNLLLSEPRHKKHLEVPRNQVTQTERKINPRQNLHKALFNKAKMMQNLESPAFDPLNSKERSLNKNNKSSDMCKKLNFSNEDNENDNNKENAQNAKNNSQLDLTDSESLLDKLYGTSWRANREEILTPIKPNKPNKNSIFSSTMKTREQPQKQGDIKEKTRKAKFNLSLSSNEDEKERRKDINLILTPSKLNTNKTSNKNNNNNKNKLSPIFNKATKKTQQQKENNKKGKENNDLNAALSQLKIDIKQNQNDNKKNVNEGKKNKTNTNTKENMIKKNVFSSFSSDSNSNSDSEEESFIKLPKKTPRKKILSSSSSEQSLHTIESNTDIDTDAELKRVNNYLYNRFLNTENWQEPVYKKKNEDEEKSKAIKKLDDKKKKESKNEKATATTTTTKKTKTKSKGEEAIPVSINQVQNQKQSGGNEEEKYPSFLASLSPNIKVSDIKLKYRPYRNNFKEHKVQLARKLFDYFNENVFDNKIPKDTPLDWNDKMRGTAGYCKCRKVTRRTGVVERNCVIELATKILTSADRLRDTLIHEMCHAATFIVNEISDGHGPLWQSWTHKAMTRFPELPKISRCHDYKISTKYSYVCTKCGYTIGRHSKSLDIERKRCGYCYGTFEVFINKKKGGVDVKVPVKSTKETSGFALFVKENYGKVRTPAVTHGEAMKILGQQFSELKMK